MPGLHLGLGLGLGHRKKHPHGGGVPEWVPENAKIHIDLVGGSPQGRAWVFGVGEVAVDTLLGADANTDNAWGVSGYDSESLTADGYRNESLYLAAIGTLRTILLAGSTAVMRMKQIVADGSVVPYALSPFAADAANGLKLELRMSQREVEASSFTGPLFDVLSGTLNLAEDAAINVAALTYIGSRFEFAANGSDPEANTLDATDKPPGNPFVSFVINTGGDALQVLTVYDALPDTTGLSALSETGVTNTAPHDLTTQWYSAGETNEFTEAEAAQGNTLAAMSASDDEGNPLTWSLEADTSEVLGLTPQSNGEVWVTTDLGALGVGDTDFTLRATDPGGLYVEQEFTITVTA